MSRDLNLFQDYQHGTTSGAATSMNMTHNLQLAGYADNTSYMSFTDPNMDDYNSLARAFGLSSPSSSQVMDHHHHMTGSDQDQVLGCGGTRIAKTRTVNSSASSSSTEAGAEEDSRKIMNPSNKGSEHGGSENSKKSNNGKKKGREPRFAFVTKSEVDHLEDGYRWRKYGQKAVKNSLYPRSYYRCTAQKCTVKKRVERSYQDPSTVITTYEGQHSHPIPTTLRGSMAGMYPHPVLAGAARAARTSYALDLMFQMPPNSNYTINNGHVGSGSFYPQISTIASNLHRHQQPQHQQFHQVEDNGLLQDIVPPMFLKHDHDP